MTPLLEALVLSFPRGAQTGVAGDTLAVAHDSLAALAGTLRDTLSRAPLPGGVATVLRFLFQVPQWIQIGGALVGAGVVLALLVYVWRRRAGILTWLRTRSRQLQVGLGLGLALALVVATLAGMKSWDYMQHANAFCTGCHIMERPFRRFSAGAGKHEDLKCHDCHQQSIFASTRQLVMWVAERPEKIGAHAQVPNSRCEGCHQIQAGREAWQHVRRLAGHRVHFDSDSTPLQHLACVKCHGAEVHTFLPSTRTCEQSGCHEKQSVKLGKMAKLPEISCVTCHAFTADLPGLATRDSAVRALIPAGTQCKSCHQMLSRPAGYDLAKDPHKGSCGSCHNVHRDTLPSDARGSCATCHGDLSRSPFHQGANHRAVQTQCLTCHQPHAASVDASDCVGCHQQVRKRGLFKPPLPFDTGAVARRRVVPAQTTLLPAAPEREEHRGKGDALPEDGVPSVRDSPGPFLPPPADSFPHPRHRSLPCLTCHVVNRPGNGLVFTAPRGCDLCHHQAVATGSVEPKDCARCHAAEQIQRARPTEVRVQVGVRAPVARTVGFRHDRHTRQACADCHRPPNTAPPDSVQTCTGCHEQHHAPARDCAQCHTRPETRTAHSRATHTGCDACHTTARIAALVPARTFCLTCHAAQREHQPARECSTCHFLATPAEFRRHLLTSGSR